MPNSIASDIKSWQRCHRVPAGVKPWLISREDRWQFAKDDFSGGVSPLKEVQQLSEESSEERGHHPRTNLGCDWMSRAERSKPDPYVLCRVLESEGDVAVCTVFMDGYELPRVAFPGWVIRRKGLGVGDRFFCALRDAGRVRPQDIDTDVPRQSEYDLRARSEELFQAFERRRMTGGGSWDEYTGDGR